MRLANAPRLPFDFQGFTNNVAGYIEEIEALADDMRDKTATDNQDIREGVYGIILDPTKSFGPPLPKNLKFPHFNFAPLKNALARLEGSADALSKP